MMEKCTHVAHTSNPFPTALPPWTIASPDTRAGWLVPALFTQKDIVFFVFVMPHQDRGLCLTGVFCVEQTSSFFFSSLMMKISRLQEVDLGQLARIC